jgi:hypothetical protein
MGDLVWLVLVGITGFAALSVGITVSILAYSRRVGTN